ncbi:hypothetical protein KEM56_005784 [Ascosphaera pollenicola]|nr:hypothetical protein KEM56_005784 [Ascosphaera pollenicola]
MFTLPQEEEKMRQIPPVVQELRRGQGYVYVQRLEEKLRRLNEAGAGAGAGAETQRTPPPSEATPVMNDAAQDIAGSVQGNERPVQSTGTGTGTSPPSPSTFGEQLTALALEATAERHLGSTTGLPFAKLTQMILRRLTPDKANFVFQQDKDKDSAARVNVNCFDLSDPFNDSDSFYRSLSESVPANPLLFGDLFLADLTEPDDTLDSLAWPNDEAHVHRLVDFYFAHSHTLYPILLRSEVMATLDRIRQNPCNLAAHAPTDLFRAWMILAIGSTAYSSVTLSEESESMLYYNKALQYSEQALASDEIPFEDADEEYIHPDSITPRSSLQPSLMSVPLHILSLRKIAGKISKQVYGNAQNTNLTCAEREAIIASLHQELLDWRRNMPFPLPTINDSVPHLSTTWYDFNYYTHLAMIYRPSPLCPVSDLKRIKTLEMAASMSLRQAYSMHQQQRFAYNWLNFLSLFTSTLSLVYAITAQPDDLGAVLRETRAIADLDIATQLFDTLGLKFVAAKKIQSMVADIHLRYKEVLASKDSSIGPTGYQG